MMGNPKSMINIVETKTAVKFNFMKR